MTLKELLENNTVSLARLPKANDYLINGDRLDLNKLEDLKGYTVPLIQHDYGAKTPVMWNSLYQKLVKYASKSNKSISQTIRYILEQFLSDR